MGLKDVLEKMRLIEVERAAGARPAAGGSPAPSAVSSADVLREALQDLPAPRPIDEGALAVEEEGAEVPDFPAIYRAAGVNDPPHGFSAYKVLEILSSPDLAGLDPKAKAAALAGFLKMNPAGPVPLRDVIQDAVRRDQALDRFEEFLRTKLRAAEERAERDNLRLQAEIDALLAKNRERMEANRRARDEELRRFQEWQARKRREEQRLQEAVAPFVEPNPISVGGESPDQGQT
jgi:hypothetical protein